MILSISVYQSVMRWLRQKQKDWRIEHNRGEMQWWKRESKIFYFKTIYLLSISVQFLGEFAPFVRCWGEWICKSPSFPYIHKNKVAFFSFLLLFQKEIYCIFFCSNYFINWILSETNRWIGNANSEAATDICTEKRRPRRQTIEGRRRTSDSCSDSIRRSSPRWMLWRSSEIRSTIFKLRGKYFHLFKSRTWYLDPNWTPLAWPQIN